jgi:hypothetical protein
MPNEESKEATIKALNRFVQQGILAKFAKGKFYKPESSPFGLLAPSLKEQTLVEKIVSLLRSSFDQAPILSIGQKIHHFYDIHYLLYDVQCQSFVHSDAFAQPFHALFHHDQTVFEYPQGWQTKTYNKSPLMTEEFHSLWQSLSKRYQEELSALAFAPIPSDQAIAESFLLPRSSL